MRFHSTASHLLTFELLERRIAMEPRAELDVPDEHAWLVGARQLPLAKGPSPLGAGAPKARVERIAAPAPRPRAPVVDDLADVDEDDGAPGADIDADEGGDAAVGAGDADEAALDASIAAAAATVGRPPARRRRPGQG